MANKEFFGIFPYLVTPLDEQGRLKEQVLADLVDHLIRQGVHGVTPLGSTGEAPYLDWATRKRTVEVVMSATAGRVPVVAGICSTSTQGAIQEAEEVEKLGVDGILTMMPSYFPLADAQVVGHFRAVARSVSCPIVLYTNPKFQTWDFTVEALRQLAEEPNIQYLKDASGNVGKLVSLVSTLGSRIKIFSDTSSVPLFMFLIGGVGWMSGPACVIPKQSIELYETARQKRWDEAALLQIKQWPLNLAFQRFTLSACVKAGLEMQGFPVGPPVPPQKQLNAEERKTLEKILRDLGAL
ncbi:MAG: dihydrodipicolinate synthase family protein [Syntrophales bacterium]|jgi:4-hydroxy-tetrahydrodipicolinate synthase|nr:dihydrodipicolinate synthase family protein [Syntrophales bacterium]